jgi:DNA topoisomerase-1
VTELLDDEPAEAEEAPKGARKKAAAKPKPRTASLFKDMSPETVSLDDALRLLSLPRLVGTDPETGDEITAQNGRYGPYLKKGTDSRSLASESQLFDLSLDEALKIYAEPKRRGRAAQAPLRELGADPASGQPVLVKEGRFGPYVTDGEVNATLRKDDDPESITLERAAELLADKRARGPAKKTTRKAAKAPAKKSAAKSATKGTAKKATAKKTAAKNPASS